MIVYCITNNINGKKYIGMTGRTLEERWKSHCSAAKNGSPFRFHSAIRKYGEDAFCKEILFDGLGVEECRTIEECTIQEYNTQSSGYNAKPGGCGGWIVPDDKYDEWIQKVTHNSTLENNGRWSGYSDDFILDECVRLFHEYEEPEEFSYAGILAKLRALYEGIPKSFSKNRFSEYENSFKVGLSRKLNIPVEDLNKLSNKKSKRHRESSSGALTGRLWYSNDELGISKTSKNHPGIGWCRGRKYGIKN